MSSHSAKQKEAAFISIGESRDEKGSPLVVALGAGIIGTIEELKSMISRFEDHQATGAKNG